MVSVDGLTVEFGGTTLFKDVSFVINPKDRIALMGKNGAGKSTLLKILAGMRTPTRGAVSVPKDCTVCYLPQHMMTEDGHLSDIAKKAIAGILEHADAITAMGNKVPTSYFRLVPHQEAPTSICWGDRNRSVLVRVPLGWTGEVDMCTQANPLETLGICESPQKQTAELRSADCSADIYQLIAAMVVAARKGFEDPDSLRRAEEMYVSVNIHDDSNKEKLAQLKSLPDSCAASADALERDRKVFEEKDIFSPQLINGIMDKLRRYHDEDLREKIDANHNKMMEVVRKYWHCG